MRVGEAQADKQQCLCFGQPDQLQTCRGIAVRDGRYDQPRAQRARQHVAQTPLGAPQAGGDSVPIIVVTIVDQPSMGAALGADEYLVKPVERAALLAAVERCLVRRGGARPQRPILVVEDDPPTREVITELLTDQGYAVATAADGAEARAQVVASLPELVILDLLLPRVSGFELLAEWRASPRTADLPVFVLTSKDLTREEELHLRAHAELLLRKEQPWQQTLLSQLRRVVTQNAPETA